MSVGLAPGRRCPVSGKCLRCKRDPYEPRRPQILVPPPDCVSFGPPERHCSECGLPNFVGWFTTEQRQAAARAELLVMRGDA